MSLVEIRIGIFREQKVGIGISNVYFEECPFRDLDSRIVVAEMEYSLERLVVYFILYHHNNINIIISRAFQ